MRTSDEGLRNDALRAALTAAASGDARTGAAKLEDLLCRLGGGADPRPNLRLAAALGVEIVALSSVPVRLLARFGAEDAASDDPRIFLPVAAAHAWAALLRAGREPSSAWAALGELAADERGPVRVGTLDALAALAVTGRGALDLVTNASRWLLEEDRDKRFSAAALVLEVLHDRRVITALAAEPILLEYVSRTIDEIANAPRSAERLQGRRRLLMSLPPTLATIVVTLAPGDVGPAWLENICATAGHPEVRKALSDAILRLHKTGLGRGSAITQRLRQVLETSAKPLRDPSRVRRGTGRGKASRPMR
jgi:hypothetical protein